MILTVAELLTKMRYPLWLLLL